MNKVVGCLARNLHSTDPTVPRQNFKRLHLAKHPANDELIGKIIKRQYEIVERIETGGMARIYKALDRKKRNVAVKISVREEGNRFIENEGLFLSQLNHPNIVKLLDEGEFEGRQYLVLEHLGGKDLQIAASARRLSLELVQSYFMQVCDALTHVHGMELVHRDLKPTNILLSDKDSAKLIDFGLTIPAKDIEETGTVGGTLVYMAPEQIRGKIFDHRADIYALGITIYEVVFGQRPFPGDGIHEIMDMHQNWQPRLPTDNKRHPNIPHSLGFAIIKALQRDPEMRYQTAEELKQTIADGCH